jgi:opacity protein-like surface antigen
MKKVLFASVVAGSLLAVTPAFAQDDKPIWVNIGGSVTMTMGDVADRFGTGGGFNFGVTFKPTPIFGLQVAYEYDNLAGKDTFIPTIPTGTALIESHHNMHVVNFNALVEPGGDMVVKPYFIGGGGFAYRTVSLTTPDVGFTTWCDPYWLICYPVAVEIDRIIGDRSSWDPTMNFGGGVSFRIGESARFYVEARYQYVWGPEFTDLNGDTQKANSQYFPITFGFRF